MLAITWYVAKHVKPRVICSWYPTANKILWCNHHLSLWKTYVWVSLKWYVTNSINLCRNFLTKSFAYDLHKVKWVALSFHTNSVSMTTSSCITSFLLSQKYQFDKLNYLINKFYVRANYQYRQCYYCSFFRDGSGMSDSESESESYLDCGYPVSITCRFIFICYEQKFVMCNNM